jgi:hypothetical protein
MELRQGQTCAACVSYPGTGACSWIIAKIEKKGVGNKYIVRDAYGDDSECETYAVESNRIAPFPAVSEDYKAKERVLALWKDQESGLWSTTFYEAVVTEVNNERKQLSLIYQESEVFQVDMNRVTKFPPDFTA